MNNLALKNLHTLIPTATENLIRNHYFCYYKAWKNKSGSLNLYNISFKDHA